MGGTSWRVMTGVGALVFVLTAIPAWSNIALRFVATQVDAPMAALVVAKQDASGRPTLRVLKVIFGGEAPATIAPQHPDWFNDQPRDGRQYVVLLANSEAYRGPVTPDGMQMIGCGVVNALEVADGVIVDPSQYDVKYTGTSKRLMLATVERDLVQSHRVRQVSNYGFQPTDGAPSIRASCSNRTVRAAGG